MTRRLLPGAIRALRQARVMPFGVFLGMFCASCHRLPTVTETSAAGAFGQPPASSARHAFETPAASNTYRMQGEDASTGKTTGDPDPCNLDESDEFKGVEASALSEVIVAWTKKRIAILGAPRDVLDGREPVGAVTVGADGTVYAIRGTHDFGIAKPGAREVWRRAPVAGQSLELQVLGDWVAWLVYREKLGPVLVLTRDRGQSWMIQQVPAIDEGRFHLSADGTLNLAARVYDCHDGDYAVHYVGRIGTQRWREVPWPTPGYPENSSLGHDGFAYGTYTVSGREWTYALSYETPSRQLLRLARGDETVVDSNVPADMYLAAVDNRGRPLGVAGGRVWMWSPEEGWKTLTGCGLAEPPQPDRL